MSIRLLILGAGGQLGSAFSNAPLLPPHIQLTTLTHAQLDVTDSCALKHFFERQGPFHAVINTAVYMPVDNCEKDPERAIQTNGLALLTLAHLCKASGTLLVHFSTDYVFDGLKGNTYTETDLKRPLNVYGRSKYIGELILESVACPYLLLRSSWIFSRWGQNFVKKVVEWSSQDRDITIVDDQVGCPTFAGDITSATFRMITSQLEGPQPSLYGTFHLCGQGEVSWYDYAQFILKEIARFREVKVRLKPIHSTDYQKRVSGVADRPAYASLNCEKIKTSYGISQNSWQEAIKDVVKELVCTG